MRPSYMLKITLAFVICFMNTGAVLASGKALYKEYCASCHGVELEGQEDWKTPNDDGSLKAPPHDASGHTWHHSDRLLFFYSKYGGDEALKTIGVTGVKSAMPAFKDVLDDSQIWKILSYIKSTWPKREAEYQKKISDQDAANQ